MNTPLNPRSFALAVMLAAGPAGLLAQGRMSADLVATAPASSADADYKAVMALKSEDMSARVANLKNSERAKLSVAHADALCEAALRFYEKYPTDPRRWDMVLAIKGSYRQFIKEIKPGYDANPPVYSDLVVDKDAQAAWSAKVAGLVAEMAAAKDLNPSQRQAVDTDVFTAAVMASTQKGSRETGAIPTPQTFALIKDFAVKYPDSEAPFQMTARNLMYTYEATHTPAESKAVWEQYVDSPNKHLAEIAAQKVASLGMLMKPIDLAFTALDGREVDLAKLRGKVVLLDFWATWCGPCMAELPNVKKVYQAYHDKGFEIVGVSCDVAPANGGPHGQAAYAKTGPEVLEFTRTHGMPWPEHYEGKKHNEGGNSLAARFSVTGIPGSFLIDKTGHVVATNLRGAALDEGVRHLLGLPAEPGTASKVD
jgi:thiol-disulfide isomerase/thioredoxin